MKVRLPHPFFTYASQFTMESMIYSTCYWAKEIAFNTQNANFGFSGEVKYTINLNNKPFSQKCNIVQTWLIDMLYHIICKCRYGHKEIGKDESLHLIALYNDYADDLDAEYLKKDEDAILYVMGFFGEQSRIQGPSLFFEEFSREKYMLDTISYRAPADKSSGIDVKQEFYEETHYTTDEYSALLLLIWGLFSQTMLVVNQRELDRMVKYKNPILSNANVLDVISKNSITIEEIRSSPLGRQVFYSKPIIKIGDDYIASNPYLMLALFTNSNYWVLRNKYRDLRSQKFTNAFGVYYETYLEEVLSNCLAKNCFERIEEDSKEKRADWHIKFDNYHFFVEQKSSLSLLGIKHSHPDVKAMKKHMMDNWGEAINQLNTTQRFYNTPNAIKIILVYEDYYKSKCLDELFRLHPELGNDNHFWLVSINEFETLMQLCKSNPEMALQIIQEKDQIETGRNYKERELKQLFFKNNIEHNLYLREQGIYDQEFEGIRDMCH